MPATYQAHLPNSQPSSVLKDWVVDGIILAPVQVRTNCYWPCLPSGIRPSCLVSSPNWKQRRANLFFIGVSVRAVHRWWPGTNLGLGNEIAPTL